MKKFKIALWPGDGIGQEVMPEAVKVLTSLQKSSGTFELETDHFDWGCDYYDKHGACAPPDHLEILKDYDAILLGSVGYPSRYPDHITLLPLIHCRQQFDQYACMRPAKLMPGVRSPLADPGPIDMLVIRENSEGEYLNIGGRVRRGQPEEVSVQTAIHTRRGVERILRFGFEQAMTRRNRLCMITKSNALGHSMVMWDEALETLGPEYPNVETEKLHVDAATMHFVGRPAELDVVVASNLFGDILTDLSSALVGSLGLTPSANIRPDRSRPSLFEPVHGSAPDIFGKSISNPSAMILSGAMMLDWLGLPEDGARIQSAVEGALADGAATPDLGGSLKTKEFGDRVSERIDG
jgi:tartrate dehydrogenase/decarboxylase/D-malate dehydrogenase